MSPRLLVARLGAVVLLAALSTSGASVARANPVQRENERSGTGAWSFTQPSDPGAIEGYASQVSALPGEVVGFHVRTSPVERYRVELYRLGWYGGAGGRRIACSPSCGGDAAGVVQPAPPAPDASTGEVDAGWSVTDRIRIPADAASGYYLAKFVLTSGPAAGQARAYPVIVRSSRRRRPSILVQVPVNTWQAYNSWGGKSLYGSNSTDGVPATHVSFNRPFVGLQLFREELQLVRFLEREGYDVSYQTDVDSTRHPQALADHQLVMTAGHGEYWSKAERDGFERARDLGTNLAFMGANTAYWQVRYKDGHRTLVSYKSDTDPIANPSLKTVRFRDLQPPRPECELLGVQWQGGSYGAGQPVPSYTVASGAEGDPYLRGTGLVAGSVLQGLVGHEWDGVEPGCSVPSPTVLFRYDGQHAADAVRYRAPSGARVLSLGSIHFSWGLDGYADTHLVGDGSQRSAPADPRVQAFMRNALADLAPAAAPQVDRTAPEVSVVAPRSVRMRSVLTAGLRIRVGCSESCRLEVRLLILRPRGGRSFGRAHGTLASAGTVRLILRSTLGAQFASRGQTGVRALRLVVSATDAAGNRRVVKRRIAVRR